MSVDGSTQSRSSRGDPRWIGATALFFLVSWLLTFNGAHVNGDDVLSLAKLEFRNAFVPNFKRDWVPNRMLDGYGRDLLSAGFDLWFFSVRSVVPVDFFVLFKVYVATVHAAFLTTVLCYIRRTAAASGDTASGIDSAVVSCFLAVVVLALFPWRNLTYFVAYQLAAFLCFVLLNEVTRDLVALVRQEDGDEHGAPAPSAGRYASLVLLSFVCAFSLEAYAAIVLLSMLLPAALVLHAIRARLKPGLEESAQGRRSAIALVMLTSVTFCAIAILIAVTSSQRAEVTSGAGALVFSGLGDSGLAWLSSRRGVIAVLLCTIPVGIAALMRWRVVDRRARGSGALLPAGPMRTRDPQAWIHASAMAVVVVSSVVVTAMVSFKARSDYFSHSSYPWGALLLVAKLFATCTVVLLALGMSKRNVALRSAVLLLAFMAGSRGALDVVGESYASHRMSQKLQRIYDTLGAGGGVVTDSGLDLASIPMQARPLPTIDSPEWFVGAYERLFEKYLGVSGKPIFK